MNIFKKYILIFTFLLFTLNLFLLMGSANTANYPLTIIDDTGSAVTIPEEPQRIISTAPSNSEILFALGLGDKVVGVTDQLS